MKATPGDWLVIQSSRDGRPARFGEIVATAPGGVPPFTVHWVDTGRMGLVFPGPDATVVSAERRAALERQHLEQAQRVQEAIAAGHRG